MNCARSIHRAPWPSRQIIEDGDLVALIEQQFSANAADVSGAADDQNFHAPQRFGSSSLSKQSSNWWRQLLAFLF